jgi:hypothetical protein
MGVGTDQVGYMVGKVSLNIYFIRVYPYMHKAASEARVRIAQPLPPDVSEIEVMVLVVCHSD